MQLVKHKKRMGSNMYSALYFALQSEIEQSSAFAT